MATVTNLITDVRYILLDSDDQAYTNDMLLSYYNEAADRFAAETHCMQGQIDITDHTANKITYASLLATLGTGQKILLPIRVELDNSSGDTPLVKAAFFQMKDKLPASTTTPTRWSLFGEVLYFDLDPSVSGADFDFTVYASYIPSQLTSVDSTILIPAEWHTAIKKYMIFCARLQARDAGLASGAFAEYEKIRTEATEFYRVMLGV